MRSVLSAPGEGQHVREAPCSISDPTLISQTLKMRERGGWWGTYKERRGWDEMIVAG